MGAVPVLSRFQLGRVAAVLMMSILLVQGSWAQPSLGVGMVTVRLDQPLYFYGVAEPDAPPHTVPVQDSVTFGQQRHHAEIATAPPWFVPEVLKLDYGLLLLRARTLTRTWVEVVVSERTGETRWVDRAAVDLRLWPTFLLSVVAVEVNDPQANPIRSGPGAGLPRLNMTPALLRPLAIRGDWMQVGPSDLSDAEGPTGWVRWRDGDRLLITYSLLS